MHGFDQCKLVMGGMDFFTTKDYFNHHGLDPTQSPCLVLSLSVLIYWSVSMIGLTNCSICWSLHMEFEDCIGKCYHIPSMSPYKLRVYMVMDAINISLVNDGLWIASFLNRVAILNRFDSGIKTFKWKRGTSFSLSIYSFGDIVHCNRYYSIKFGYREKFGDMGIYLEQNRKLKSFVICLSFNNISLAWTISISLSMSSISDPLNLGMVKASTS